MTLRQIIYITIFATIATACQEIPRRVDNGRIIASVGNKTLQLGELSETMPTGVSGKDSIDFVSQYVERWIARQIKVREAERIFSSSVSEVEAMVASYRSALLTRKLDQYYINSSTEQPFNDNDISKYYIKNMTNFKLDHTIVKGIVVILPKSYEESSNIEKLMNSSNDENHLNLLSICERVDGAIVRDITSWTNYDTFIPMLPIVHDQNTTQYLRKKGAQSLSDESYKYLFRIDEYRSEGYTAPLEIAEPSIRKILLMQHQQEVVRKHEERLYRDAQRGDLIKNFVDEKESFE